MTHLSGMQCLALLVALSATVCWESLIAARFGACKTPLAGVRVHVTVFSKIRCEGIATHVAFADRRVLSSSRASCPDPLCCHYVFPDKI